MKRTDMQGFALQRTQGLCLHVCVNVCACVCTAHVNYALI